MRIKFSGMGVTLFIFCSMFIVLISGCPMPEPEPTVPGTMAAPTLEVGNEQLIAAWTAPNNGGSPITAYELQYRTGSGAWTEISSGIGTNTDHSITGLAKAAEYDVQVRAVNAIGAGDWSESAAATPVTVPDAPDALTLYAGTGRIVVRWTAPEDTGGKPITGYELQYRTGSGAWTEIAPAPGTHDHSITNLINGTAYEVRARAVNAQGSGNWSESATATPLRIQTPAGTAKSVSLSDAANAVIIASENLSVYLITGTYEVGDSGDITVTSATPPGAVTPPIVNIAHVFNESIGIVTVTAATTAGTYLVYGETGSGDTLFAEHFSVTENPADNAQLKTAVTDGITAWGPTADFNYIVTAAVTDMSSMFQSASTFNGDISEWDVSSVTNMGSMFIFATLFNSDISGWDVSSLTDMN
ncbi:MAG: fibronectin type III domain-containing protein, partial [Salinispira sp.]